jgi:hypothetical protein
MPGARRGASGGLFGATDGVFLKVRDLGFLRFPWLRPVDAVDPRLPVARVVRGPPSAYRKAIPNTSMATRRRNEV